MPKIGIIAGGGKLPILIGEQLIQSGNNVVFFCIESYAKKSDYENFVKTFIKLELISEIMRWMPNVIIHKPSELIDKVKERLMDSLDNNKWNIR